MTSMTLILTMGTLATILFAAFRFRQPGGVQGPQELWFSTGEARAEKRLLQIAVEANMARDRQNARRLEELRLETNAIYREYPSLASRGR